MSTKAYKNLVKGVRESKHPLMYFYWGDNLCWTIPYLKRELQGKQAKFVLRLHGSDLNESIKGNYAPLRRQIFECCDLIVPISENGSAYLAQKYPDIVKKIWISRLGVPDRGLNPYSKSSVLNVISVSNLVPIKRVDLIFEMLKLTHLTICWHHFGDGPMMHKLKTLSLVQRAGLTVKLHGRVSNREIMEFYKTVSVDLFINMSSSEGLPVSVMEALSFGVPVMATDVGGTSELVSERVGQLLRKDCSVPQAVAELEKLANLSQEKILNLRNEARKVFEEKVMAEKNYPEFYNKLDGLL